MGLSYLLKIEINLRTSGKVTSWMLKKYYWCKLRRHEITSIRVKNVMKIHPKFVLIMGNGLFLKWKYRSLLMPFQDNGIKVKQIASNTSLGNILCFIRPRSGKIKLDWTHWLCGYEIKHTSLFYQTFRKSLDFYFLCGTHLKSMDGKKGRFLWTRSQSMAQCELMIWEF